VAEGELRDHPGSPGEDPDLELLSVLGPFIRPLPPGEAERIRRTYTESGYLTRETIVRVLLGEFS
jgi:hypothetical protein